ncbi:MAG TPA: GNAT family N-acetyltransferase [Thermoleophilaceae bacterium]|nr:GNAT family N-acetyltransferase [Thermoleophilaceae bacterium]
MTPRIHLVDEADLAELLPLMRAYCDFYEVDPSDEALLAMSRALIADPELEGVQLMARNADGAAVGFATVFWSWSTLGAARIGVMNDLFVAEAARGQGVAEALIEECRERARHRGAGSLGWQTAKDNLRAQALYDRIGAKRSEWVDYSLEAGDGSPGATTPDS